MARRRKLERPDSIDAENIDAMLQTSAWQLYSGRLARELELRMNELVQPLSEADTARIRGEIKSLRLALDMPRLIMREGTKHHESTPGI